MGGVMFRNPRSTSVAAAPGMSNMLMRPQSVAGIVKPPDSYVSESGGFNDRKRLVSTLYGHYLPDLIFPVST